MIMTSSRRCRASTARSSWPRPTGTPPAALSPPTATRSARRSPTASPSARGSWGQAALERQSILITEPPSDYIRISSGLGEAPPRNIVVLPITFEDQTLAVAELASFREFSETDKQFLEQLAEMIGVV
jgi:GAF domain-containing protein